MINHLLEMIIVIVAAAIYYASTSGTTTVIGPYDPNSLVQPTALRPVDLSIDSFAHSSFFMTSVLDVPAVVQLGTQGSSLVPSLE